MRLTKNVKITDKSGIIFPKNVFQIADYRFIINDTTDFLLAIIGLNAQRRYCIDSPERKSKKQKRKYEAFKHKITLVTV